MRNRIYYVLILVVLMSLSACQNSSVNKKTFVNKESSVNEELSINEELSVNKETAANEEAPENTAGIDEADALEAPPLKESEKLPSPQEGIDVDLTQLSSTMVFAEVYNMMVRPEDYIGKVVKMQGEFAVYQEEETNAVYCAVIIADAAACCSQGIEFVWKGEHSYPDDYPPIGTEITVVGEFQTYEENGYLYCHLTDADLN